MKTRYAILALAALSAVATHGLEIESGPSAPEKRAEAELKHFISLLAEETPDLRFRIGVKFLDEFPSDKAFLPPFLSCESDARAAGGPARQRRP